MSTTNILNSTVTGVPFLEIGRISVMGKEKKNQLSEKYKQTVFFLNLFICMSCNMGIVLCKGQNQSQFNFR